MPSGGGRKFINYGRLQIEGLFKIGSGHYATIQFRTLCNMTETNQKQLGKTLWGIADQLRGAMNADDFRDYMLSFPFLRYLSDNYETAAKVGLMQQLFPSENLEGRSEK
jgi:hypothetical protein